MNTTWDRNRDCNPINGWSLDIEYACVYLLLSFWVYIYITYNNLGLENTFWTKSKT